MKNLFYFGALLLATFIFGATSAYSFRQIVVQNGDEATVYDVTQLQTAINEAAAGSDIYLPGGYEFGNCDLSKELHFYGAGAFEKNSDVTGYSYISGIRFNEGSDNSTVEGVYTGIDIYGADNITIRKCKCSVYIYDSTNNIVFKDCVISGSFDNINNKSEATFFFNCIFIGYNNLVFSTAYNSEFLNCVFHIHYSSPIGWIYGDGVESNNFENCIFIEYDNNNFSFLSSTRLNIFKNCLFNCPEPSDWGENIAEDCIFDQANEDIFEYLVDPVAYSEDNDYHLVDDCLGKNYGTDGTDLGIYGTATPFKESQTPIIPHWEAFQSDTRMENGQIDFNAEVQSETK